MTRTVFHYVTATAFFALAGQAAAQEVDGSKLGLRLSGFYLGSAAWVDREGDPDDSRDYGFGSDAEIHFEGSVVLDNGLEVGVHVEGKLEEDSASGDGDFIEEKFAFVEGVFGRVEFGDQDGVADQMALVAPTLFRGNTVNDAELDATGFVGGLGGLNHINTVTTINNGLDDFSTKITYFTPRIVGLQAGVSFTPDHEQGGSNFDGRIEDLYDQAVEVGVSYFNTFANDISLGVSAAYLTADEGSTTLDPQSWSAGVNVAFNGFTVGGSYKESEDLPLTLLGVTTPGLDNDYTAWDVGVKYETGPWGFMLAYAEDEADVGSVTVTETSAVQGGVDYMVGSGVSLGGGVQHLEDDVIDQDATAVFVETMIAF